MVKSNGCPSAIAQKGLGSVAQSVTIRVGIFLQEADNPAMRLQRLSSFKCVASRIVTIPDPAA